MNRQHKNLADQLFPIKESLDDIAVVDIPPEKRRLHTETYDFSIGTIIEYLKKGDMFIPKFQRGYVWSRSQASRLIESLIIQCPIPVIYLNQEKDERLSVIDGNQRLTSIKLFVEDEFPLYGLTAYPELSGSKYTDLDPRFKRHIKNRTLRCITILKETHPQIKIDVFERINTGAVQLNFQEVRHGVHHGRLMELIDELANEKIWKEISGFKSDNRMKGSELILRYFALSTNLKQYKKPLKRFLDSYCEKNANINEAEALKLKSQFLSVIEKINIVFGKKAFRILDSDLKPSVRNINAALYDSVMVGFTKLNPDRKLLEKINKTKFLSAYQNHITKDSFIEAIESGTSATSSVKFRIKSFQDFLKEQLK